MATLTNPYPLIAGEESGRYRVRRRARGRVPAGLWSSVTVTVYLPAIPTAVAFNSVDRELTWADITQPGVWEVKIGTADYVAAEGPVFIAEDNLVVKIRRKATDTQPTGQELSFFIPVEGTPAVGDNIFWAEDPMRLVGRSLVDDVDVNQDYNSPTYIVTGYMPVVGGEWTTANQQIYAATYVDSNYNFVARYPFNSTNRHIAPPTAAYLRVAIENINYSSFVLLLGNYGPVPISRPLPLPEYFKEDTTDGWRPQGVAYDAATQTLDYPEMTIYNTTIEKLS